MNKSELNTANTGADLLLKMFQQIEELDAAGEIPEDGTLRVNIKSLECILHFSMFCYLKMLDLDYNPNNLKQNKSLH